MAHVPCRAVGSPVALAPGRLVPQAGGDLRVVPGPRARAAAADLVPGVVDLVASTWVPEAPVADSDASVAKV